MLDRNEIFQTWQFQAEEPLLSVTWILIVFGVLLAVILAIKVFQLWQRQRLTEEPGHLFQRVTSRVGLAAADQSLLARIARQQQLKSALTLVISEGALSEHAKRFLASLPGHRRAAALRRIKAIRRHLFSERAPG